MSPEAKAWVTKRPDRPVRGVVAVCRCPGSRRALLPCRCTFPGRLPTLWSGRHALLGVGPLSGCRALLVGLGSALPGCCPGRAA
uniref:Uncharacterized protein n=1 Tax=Arthrobacter sp. Chr15 TaxID=447032 RepID=A6YFU2_9MICC|nr:unknown [Arthrobacter sp. Chr15]